MLEIDVRRLFADKKETKKCIGKEDTKPVVVKFVYTFANARPHFCNCLAYYTGILLLRTFYGKIAIVLTALCTFTGIGLGI